MISSPVSSLSALIPLAFYIVFLSVLYLYLITFLFVQSIFILCERYLADIYKIFAKTANETNLLQGTENIRTRAKELYDYFECLEKEGRILDSVKDFNSETAIDITEKSLVLNKTKDNLVNNDIESIRLVPDKEIKAAIVAATGMGVLGYINKEIQKISGSQPKQESGLFIIREENKDQDNEYDNGDIF